LSQQSAHPILVAQFPDACGLLGITEIQHDLFAVVKGKFDPAGDLVQGSFSVWKADFRNGTTPALSVIANTPNVTILNGITTPGKGSNSSWPPTTWPASSGASTY
jgi:hypothetical protein